MIWGWKGSYEGKGELWGESCLRASTFKGASQCGTWEPQKPEEDPDVCLVVQTVDGMVMTKHPIYQDVWCWRAVNQERSQKHHHDAKEGSKVRLLGHLLYHHRKILV